MFAGEHSPSTFRTLYAHFSGLQHCSTNSLLYLRIIQDKYITLYRKLVTQLHTYVSAIRVLAKGYLPNTLKTPTKLQEILIEVKRMLQITNPDYDLVIDRPHLYYDMPLITFGIENNMNLIIQIPIFVQPYTQKPLILYQLEMVPIPILDQTSRHNHTPICRLRKLIESCRFLILFIFI